MTVEPSATVRRALVLRRALRVQQPRRDGRCQRDEDQCHEHAASYGGEDSTRRVGDSARIEWECPCPLMMVLL